MLCASTYEILLFARGEVEQGRWWKGIGGSNTSLELLAGRRRPLQCLPGLVLSQKMNEERRQSFRLHH